MDISEEPVIFPVDIQKTMAARHLKQSWVSSGLHCERLSHPQFFTASENKVNSNLNGTWLDDEKNIFTTNYILYLSSMVKLCSICILGIAETWL